MVRGHRVAAAVVVLTLVWMVNAHAAVTPELQHAIRDATFEVVMKKPDKDPVSYEKPLPLELLPFYERNDLYRSVGTAFALGHNTYVTAAHVMVAGIGSQFGVPALRHADGSVYAIDRIVKFSMQEDFVVFTLRNDPGLGALPVNREPKLDEPVLAVGNALGEGIVIRDGLFTSETPEEQDGRWKWIRFSAAASPGNSGGPLLDASGRVIGVVSRKSLNENLNYSLPIGLVLDGEEMKARFDQRLLIRLPYLHATSTLNFKDQFALPLTWEAFGDAYQKLMRRHDDDGRASLLNAHADMLFPKGPGTEDLLFEPEANEFRPRLIAQQSDGRWVPLVPNYKTVPLPGDGSIGVANGEAGVLLRLIRSNHAADDAFYGDSKAFMDVALKALDVRRTVGPDQVVVTSLGAAQTDTIFVDAFGRKWQQRVWAVPFLDAYIVGLLLPTPDGYAAIIEFAPSLLLREMQAQMQLMAGQIDVSYRGTLTQWQAALQRRSLLPEALAGVKLDKASPWTLQTKRFAARVPAEVLALTDQSPLSLIMGFMKDGARTVWDVQEVWWSRDDREDTSVGLWRRARPPAEARLDLRNKFASMRERRSPYDGSLSRDTVETYSASDILSVPGSHAGTVAADLLYGLTIRLTGHPTMRDAGQSLHAFAAGAHIVEPGVGPDIAEAHPAGTALDESIERMRQSIVAAAAVTEAVAGRDIRGRVLRDDLNDFFAAVQAQMAGTPVGGPLDEAAWNESQSERLRYIEDYWRLYPGLACNRDVWKEFLARNRLPPTSAHAASVLDEEAALLMALRSPYPTWDWAERGRRLGRAYVSERNQVVRSNALFADRYQPRTSPCPAPATTTSGAATVKISRSPRSAEEFWSMGSKRRGEEGMVIISLKVSAAGCATAASIVGSSGFDALDDAALKYYETLEFLPADAGGKGIDSVVKVPINFKLTD